MTDDVPILPPSAQLCVLTSLLSVTRLGCTLQVCMAKPLVSWAVTAASAASDTDLSVTVPVAASSSGGGIAKPWPVPCTLLNFHELPRQVVLDTVQHTPCSGRRRVQS